MGGSTVWGTGVADDQTIPAHFKSISQQNAVNLGEAGWNSRQSLNLLLNLMAHNHKPGHVIFYDGVNEIIQCRSELIRPPSYLYESKFQDLIFNRGGKKRILLDFIVSPYKSFFKKPLKASLHDCDTDNKKARIISANLLNNWEAAYHISKARGFGITFIVQPHVWSSTSETSYLAEHLKQPEQLSFKRQYETIYPILLADITKKCLNIENKEFCANIKIGAKWINKPKTPIFIDFCYLNSEGNQIIASKIFDTLTDSSRL